MTYCCGGNNLLSDNPQGVHHRDVAQPPSNTQSRVTILNKRAQTVTRVSVDGEVICVFATLGLFTYHSDGIGLGSVLQQYIDDVCVSLLGCLVKRSVSILKRDDGR